MEQSIGDFALSLLQESKATQNITVVDGSIDKDISNVKITQSQVDNILLESFGIETKSEPADISEEQKKKNELKEQWNYHFSALKKLIPEMTTCGMIGVNMAPKAKQKVRRKIKK